DSVGAWQTMMPSSVAASVSTSSTPTVYLATMRRRCEACMMRRLIGGVAHGRAHERNRVARRLHDGLFVRRARQLPVAVAEDEFAAQAFERVDGLGRLLARGKDQDFRL